MLHSVSVIDIERHLTEVPDIYDPVAPGTGNEIPPPLPPPPPPAPGTDKGKGKAKGPEGKGKAKGPEPKKGGKSG